MVERRWSLPEPKKDGPVSLEGCLETRRSIRSFGSEPVTLEEVSQLLWAAQGITSETGQRSAPSAGALYALEVGLIALDVDGLEPGFYRYVPESHELARRKEGDLRRLVSRAALEQSQLSECPAMIVIAADYEKLSWKYGSRSVRYGDMEAGHSAQNVYLQATSLGLGTVVVGAFEDELLASVLGLRGREQPLYLMPVGRPGEDRQ